VIRILRIIARLNIGGPALHVTHLARGLNPNRFVTRLITGNIGKDEGDMSDLARDLDWHIIPELGRDLNPADDLITLLKLWNAMRQWQPHIVHTHTAKAGAVGRIAAKLAGVPLIIHTFHGHTFHSYWGKFGSQLTINAERALAMITTKVIAVSDHVREDLIRYQIAAPQKILTLPLGLDLELFAAQPRSDAATPIVGIVGRLVPIKNHALFLQMARQMIADGFRGRFMIVGDGELRRELENQARDLGDRIIFTGWRRDLTKVYSEMSVVVNTSLNEGTPVSVIEAMASGVPVVATAVGGVPDVIRDHETGYLAPSGDARALADQVNEALRDGKSIARRAQEDVLKKFSKERLIKDVEGLYETLIQK
jgi:glycosyltransferase involved in cell wall biosynthesis